MYQNNKVQYFATLSVSLGLFAMGFSTGWPSLVIPKLMNNETDITISNNEIAVLSSIPFPGIMVGSVATGYIADNLGRRTAVLTSAVPMAVGMTFVAFTKIVWILCFARFIIGVGKGMIIAVVTMYTAEIADKERRGSLFLYTRVMFNFGSLIMYVFGPMASYDKLNYILMAFPVVYFLACWWIPESPYYCLKVGNVDSARKALMSLKGVKEAAIEEELNNMLQNVQKEMKSSSTVRELFTKRQYRKAIFITAGLKAAQMMAGQLTIHHYMGYIILESYAPVSLTTVFIVFGIVRFLVVFMLSPKIYNGLVTVPSGFTLLAVGFVLAKLYIGILSSVLVDRVGRRPLLFYSYLGVATCYAIIGIYFFMKEVLKVDRNMLTGYGFIPFAGIIASTAISTLGFQSITNIPGEVFPMNVKAVGMTANMIFGGILGFVVGIAFQSVKDCSGFSGVFIILSILAFAGAAFVFFVVPETKGLSLKEIQVMLQGENYSCEEVVKLNNIVGDVDQKIYSDVSLNVKDPVNPQV